MEMKIKFCEEIHRKHSEEVDTFNEYADALIKGNLNLKLNKAINQMKIQESDFKSSVEDL